MEANNEDLMQYSLGNLYFAIVLCRCRIGACDPCNCQPGDYCRRFGGAHSLLSFLEVSMFDFLCFIFGLLMAGCGVAMLIALGVLMAFLIKSFKEDW